MDMHRVGLAVDRDLRDRPISEAYAPRQVRRLIHEALVNAGLRDAPDESPLADLIQSGQSVLIKPNWVLHRNHGDGGTACLTTHRVFVEAVLAEVIKTAPGKIVLADAPVQGCDFDHLVPPSWRKKLMRMAGPIPLEIRDLRRSIATRDGLSLSVSTNLKPKERYQLFDLGSHSVLEPISQPSGAFRVSCYNPDRLSESHRPGRHRYLIARELFEADVILNLPKLKTHRKAGLTASLKNFVGINGDKDFLPHHRVGGSAQGGDCYEGKSHFKQVAEACLDQANRHLDDQPRAYKAWRVSAAILRRLGGIRSGDSELDGGWHGNDTVWRMVLDLNRIAVYGRADGQLSPTPLRRIYTLTDGIIAGQGDGPLSPDPLLLGAVSFACCSPFSDLAHCALMQLNPENIALIRESLDATTYPLVPDDTPDPSYHCNGEALSFSELSAKYGLPAQVAPGWSGVIENAAVRS